MTSRFSMVNKMSEQAPYLKFPYLTLLATGRHTEIVLCRGVGLHTVVGVTIDTAMGESFDKATNIIRKFEKVL